MVNGSACLGGWGLKIPCRWINPAQEIGAFRLMKMKLLQTALLVAGLAMGPAMGLSLAAMPAFAASALDGTTILPDPSLANGRALPASVATQGVAAVSAAEDGPLQNCSRRNPCAMPTPSRDQVTVTPEQSAVTEATHGPSRKNHRAWAGMAGLRS